ncbi:hypothetical protein E2I00_002412, partial [Balaenoptera physalus]
EQPQPLTVTWALAIPPGQESSKTKNQDVGLTDVDLLTVTIENEPCSWNTGDVEAMLMLSLRQFYVLSMCKICVNYDQAFHSGISQTMFYGEESSTLFSKWQWAPNMMRYIQCMAYSCVSGRGGCFTATAVAVTAVTLVGFGLVVGPRVKAKGLEKFTIYDGDHKVLVPDSGTLRAVPYKTYILPETFFVSASHVRSTCEERGSLILLAISKGELCLFCDREVEVQVLNASHAPQILILANITGASAFLEALGGGFIILLFGSGLQEHTCWKQKLSDMAAQKEPSCLPFIFYRAKVGSWNTLESAAHPGWFVCTSCNPGEPVGMTNTCGRRKHTELSFRQFCKAEMSPSEKHKIPVCSDFIGGKSGMVQVITQQELLQEDPIQGVLSQLIIPLAPIQDPGQGEAETMARAHILPKAAQEKKGQADFKMLIFAHFHRETSLKTGTLWACVPILTVAHHQLPLRLFPEGSPLPVPEEGVVKLPYRGGAFYRPAHAISNAWVAQISAMLGTSRANGPLGRSPERAETTEERLRSDARAPRADGRSQRQQVSKCNAISLGLKFIGLGVWLGFILVFMGLMETKVLATFNDTKSSKPCRRRKEKMKWLQVHFHNKVSVENSLDARKRGKNSSISKTVPYQLWAETCSKSQKSTAKQKGTEPKLAESFQHSKG